MQYFSGIVLDIKIERSESQRRHCGVSSCIPFILCLVQVQPRNRPNMTAAICWYADRRAGGQAGIGR